MSLRDVKMDYSINLTTIIELFALLVTLVGFIIAVASWKEDVQLQIRAINENVSVIALELKDQRSVIERDGERLSHIEGALESISNDSPRDSISKARK